MSLSTPGKDSTDEKETSELEVDEEEPHRECDGTVEGGDSEGGLGSSATTGVIHVDSVVGVAVVLQQLLGKGLGALLLRAVCLDAAGELLLDIRLDARLTQDSVHSRRQRNPTARPTMRIRQTKTGGATAREVWGAWQGRGKSASVRRSCPSQRSWLRRGRRPRCHSPAAPGQVSCCADAPRRTRGPAGQCPTRRWVFRSWSERKSNEAKCQKIRSRAHGEGAIQSN
ncbi:hypothetical protein B0H14DRAFT_3131678 [Mycena olivaceomarginata]|nr:hypothetical protein B0H14DRAFT_3131678 [Mycena olivaceomarginata]